jgi:hypothetical protein
MRIKRLQVNGERVEAVLVTGGPSFRLYSAPNGYAIQLKRQVILFADGTPEAAIAGQYAMLRYQPDQGAVRARFEDLLSQLKQKE